MKLVDLIRDSVVTFQYYRQGNLMYKTSSGFEFPVPVSDTNDATFPAQDKATFFMRWIRRQFDLQNKPEQVFEEAASEAANKDDLIAS